MKYFLRLKEMNGRQGFSFIEVVITMGLAVGMVFVLSSLRKNAGDLENLVNQKLRSRQDFEQAFQVLITELRSAGNSEQGAYPLISGTTTSISFYSDIDSDGLSEQVRYFIATTTLATTTFQKGVIEPVGTSTFTYPTSTEVFKLVVDNVIPSTSTPVFQYFDSNATSTQSPMSFPLAISNVRLVKVSLFADITPGKAPKPAFFSQSISVRNLRSN